MTPYNKLIEMHISLFLYFLSLRSRIFTESDMSEGEMERLRRYAVDKEYSREMFLSFGKVTVKNGYVVVLAPVAFMLHFCFTFYRK